MKSKLNPVADLPVLPAYASGALYFLDSGDYLLRYRMEQSIQDCPAPEGSKFVTVRDVQAAFGGAEVDTGWIQPGIIRCGYCAQGDWFAYASPSKKMEIKIMMDSSRTRKLEVPVPPTVMLGIGTQYYLWAVPPSGLTEYSPLYNAPFPNIHEGGMICWGQNTPPSAHHKNAKAAWDLFFASGFNKDLADNKSMKFKDDVRRMLTRVARQKLDSYPEEDLVRSPCTLKRMLGEYNIERRNTC